MHQASIYTGFDGVKAYSKLGLKLYDSLVIRGFAPHVWGCSARDFLEHYRKHVTANHADIGVGTGYFLDRCDFGSSHPRIALIDLRPECLAHAYHRLARYRPETHLRDARKALSGIAAFDSICLGGLLHCLPGAAFYEKHIVFHALHPIVRPGTKVFGYTLINDGMRYWRRTLAHYCLHRLRVVNFANDRIDDLALALRMYFVDCKLDQIGSFAFFSAVVPPSSINHH
jgi:hypothetical protein